MRLIGQLMPALYRRALVLSWAQQVGDVQLHGNLRGYDPSGTLACPEAATRAFLPAPGVPPGQIPSAPQAQVPPYHSLLADRLASAFPAARPPGPTQPPCSLRA
jgi:hypothetical protein